MIKEVKKLGVPIGKHQPVTGTKCSRTNLPLTGLNYLAKIDHLFVIKKFENWDTIMYSEYSRSYAFKNNYGQDVYFAMDGKLC